MPHQHASAFELILRGNLVTPDGLIRNGWLAVLDGKIAAIGEGTHPDAGQVHDHGQSWLLPGVIDGQVHACSWRGLQGLESTTRSALAGGVTTIVDMPYDDPEPVNSVERLQTKIEAVSRWAHCDVALYGTLASGQAASDIIPLVQAGVCAIKISSFENHPSRFPRIETDQMLDILETAAGLGIPIGLHNEDQNIVRSRTARLKAAGETSIAAHSPSRPQAAELSATAQFLELAAATGAHAHIVHLSVPRGLDLVAQYSERGYRATAEMCIHYLLLDEKQDGPRLGALMKVNPPIRGGVRDGLWNALYGGQIEFVSSDHSGWPLERKMASSIFDASAGIPGLETLLMGFYTGLSTHGSEPLEMCARYLSEKPAKFFGLWPQKGALALGADADVAVVAVMDWIYDAATAHDELKWSPFDGAKFAARVTSTYLRGTLAYQDGQVVSRAGTGRFCKPIAR